MLAWTNSLVRMSVLMGVVLFVLTLSLSSGDTIVVDDDGGDWADYTQIRHAVQNASQGDTIRVYAGIYYGYHNINAEVCIIGNGSDVTFLDAFGNWSAFDVNRNNVTIDGFNINGTNPYIPDDPAVVIQWQDNIIIENCIIQGGRHGLWINQTRNSVIRNCTIRNITWFDDSWGVFAYSGCDNLTVIDCEIYNCSNGILLSGWENSYVLNSTIHDNELSGLSTGEYYYSGVENNLFDGLDMWNNDISIGFSGSNNTLSNSTIAEHNGTGIGVGGQNNTVDNCTVTGQGRTSLQLSGGGHLIKNTVLELGIFISSITSDNYRHDVINTTANEKEILYLRGESDSTIIGDFGQFFLVDCDNVTICDQFTENVCFGGAFINSSNLNLTNVTIQCTTLDGFHFSEAYDIDISQLELNATPFENSCGIEMYSCDNITFWRLSIANYSDDGFVMSFSDDIELNRCEVTSVRDLGLYLYNSNDIVIDRCSIEDSGSSVTILESDRVRIDRLECTDDKRESIRVYRSSDLVINGSSLWRGLYIDDLDLLWSDDNNDTNGTADGKTINVTNSTARGKPIVFVKDVNGGVLDLNASQVFIINSSHLSLSNLITSGVCTGVVISASNNISIDNASIENYPYEGVHVSVSSDIRLNRTNVTAEREQSSSQYQFKITCSDNISVENSTISSGNRGVRVDYSDDCSLSKVVVHNTTAYGIYASSSDRLSLRNSTVLQGEIGIRISSSYYIGLFQCRLEGLSQGATFHSSRYNKVIELTAIENGRGCYLNWGSNENLFVRCNMTDGGYGLYFEHSDKNEVLNCSFINNSYGLYLRFSDENSFHHNEILNNSVNGVSLYRCYNNSFHHNNFGGNEDPQAYEYDSDDQWDDGSEGNWWSDYNGSDGNGDGIGDTPYNISDDQQDRYPLIDPVETNAPEKVPDLGSLTIVMVGTLLAYLLVRRKGPRFLAIPWVGAILAILILVMAPVSTTVEGELKSPTIMVNMDHLEVIELPYNERPYSYNDTITLYVCYPTDDQGVIVTTRDNTDHYKPVQISQKILHFLDSYVKTEEERYLERSKLFAGKLMEVAVESDGAIFLPHTFEMPIMGTDVTMQPNWYSGMSQGQALSAFVRLYSVTGDERYKEMADGLFSSFLHLNDDSAEGDPWVAMIDEEGYYWIEEYPMEEPCHVLNGFVFAVYGLYDYYQLTGDETCRRLLTASLTTIAHHAYLYRNPGELSCYDLKYRAVLPKYHRIHIRQMRMLERITGVSIFGEYVDQFKADV